MRSHACVDISISRCPNEFLCPITCELMEEPVTIADGHSYERVAIERWLQVHVM